MRSSLLSLVSHGPLFLIAACSSSPEAATTPGAAAPGDPPSTPAPDAPAVTYPAAHPEPPTVLSSGGPIVAAPTVVPVFFEGDALQPRLEAFFQALAASSYWPAVTQDYGVGTLTVGPSIVTNDPPPATDAELGAWLAKQPGAGPSTIFHVFYPSTAVIDVHGKKSCGAFDGYHNAVRSKTGAAPLVYAVSARCEIGSKMLDAITTSASHELVEAATDPFYYDDPAYGSADAAHAAWTVATVGEVGDMCELEPGASGRLVADFMVQRSWSNAAAKAGHDPCVPGVPGPYFAAAAVLDEDVSMDAGQGAIATKGVRVAVGNTRTVDVALYSDGPTDEWTVEARDGSALFGGPRELDLSFDTATGKNGDVLHLTVHPLRAGSFGGSLLVITSKSGSTQHLTLGFVAN